MVFILEHCFFVWTSNIVFQYRLFPSRAHKSGMYKRQHWKVIYTFVFIFVLKQSSRNVLIIVPVNAERCLQILLFIHTVNCFLMHHHAKHTKLYNLPWACILKAGNSWSSGNVCRIRRKNSPDQYNSCFGYNNLYNNRFCLVGNHTMC